MSWENWLKDKMDKRKYRHRSAAINDIVAGLRPFPDLKPEVDKFAISQQRAEDFICCKGSIPVRFKGSVYNIPIKIWILDNHPFVPPLVFVTPTSEMVIMPGRYVDTTGRVYLSYLTDWKNPTSDLHGLIQVLCMVFGDNPPVFSRGSQLTGRPPPQNFCLQPNCPGTHHQGMRYPTSSSVELRKRVEEFFEQAKRELDVLGSTNNELKERILQLEEIMDRLQQEENMVTSNVEILEKKNKELAVLMDKLENDTANMNIDEAVVTTAPLHNQTTWKDKSYKDWSNEEVCDWFLSIGMGEFVPSVKEHKIKGTHLPNLSKDDLIELGVHKLGERLTIDEEISKVCSLASNEI